MWVDVIGEIQRRFVGKPAMCSRIMQSALMFQQGDGCGGNGLTLTPANGSYSSLFVWLHGLGDTPFSWYGRQLSSNLFLDIDRIWYRHDGSVCHTLNARHKICFAVGADKEDNRLSWNLYACMV